MEIIIDRFEGEYAVVECEEKILNLHRCLLPPEAKEGDILDIHISINVEKTELAKNKMEKLFHKLFEK